MYLNLIKKLKNMMLKNALYPKIKFKIKVHKFIRCNFSFQIESIKIKEAKKSRKSRVLREIENF
jgi:hypothetical protein